MEQRVWNLSPVFKHEPQTDLFGMSDDSGYEMQGVLCLPPGQLQEYTMPNKITDMEITEQSTKEINQSDSGIFSAKETSKTIQSNDSDSRSDCSSPDRKFLCPICKRTLTSQHEFTLHIRSHNNDESQDPEKGFTCKICNKELSSSSSLDRHVYVHSGERPFTCKHCGDTFTTNGNMHRHMRTHKDNNYESDASVDSNTSNGSKSIECNNNKVDPQRGIAEKRKLEETENGSRSRKKPNLELMKCPVCERNDFANDKSLDLHIEDTHPDHWCHQCNQIFTNPKLLNYHRHKVHASESNGKVQIVNNVLSDVDFSSELFRRMAILGRDSGNRQRSNPSGSTLNCSKCVREFPSVAILEQHERECGFPGVGNIPESERAKIDFFFHLLKLKNSPEKCPMPTSYSPKIENEERIQSDSDILAPIPSIISMTTSDNILKQLQQGGGKSNDAIDSEKPEEEETQDVFAAEVRLMKLRGEFPCKLCTAVFPNLRALKGHNRIHLNNAQNGTYRCNMCPHWSMDKAALIRHMRTHNGDRPYECSLCNYAFTTKANCERHLRNRHGKSTREEVKKAIIYHPSEDPTNDPTLISKTIDAKTPNTSTNSIEEENSPEILVPAFPQTFPRTFSPSSSPFITSTPTKRVEKESVGEQQQALDLSKKKSNDEKTEDLCKKPIESSPYMPDIFANQILKETPNPALLYSTLYESIFKVGMPPLHPLMFPSPMLPPPVNRKLGSCCFPMPLMKSENKPSIKPEDLKPLSINTDSHYNDSMHLNGSPVITNPKPEMAQSPNATKMVIKNGVLMPKQKQRRYRTERPFSCEHCAARFTLRSNMERHIKQQHPTYWKERHRSSLGHPGRKPQMQLNSPSMKSVPCYPLNIPSYDLNNKINEIEEAKHSSSHNFRYAILQQHLKTAQEHSDIRKRERDEDDSLVIDDGDNEGLIKKEPRSIEIPKSRILEDKLRELREKQLLNEKLRSENQRKSEEVQDLVPVSQLLDIASQQPFQKYFRRDGDVDENDMEGGSEEDEEGLVASGSTSEGNSGTDENRSESDNAGHQPTKKKSAYSLAPNRVCCPYCSRKFPWTSSLRRHILTHTGQKPFKCSHCTLLFTTKSNCDRHLLRKHGNSATTITNDTANNNSFMMRNVPERPFKCSNCPSSTFSTYSNLKKHMSSKHGTQDDRQGYEAGSSEDEKNNSDHRSDWEAQISRCRINSTANLTDAQVVNSDLPFKCHLCDSSFSERQECLDHIKDRHISEYDLLMNKNALDPNASTPDEGPNHADDDDNEIRGKFPDYSNRKVICAFCMRRFWSAEDLRRHMRTHTGERPFSCDICRRRFTLKHSMLRHRKKHDGNSVVAADAPSDEDAGMHHLDIKTPLLQLKVEKSDESDAGGSGESRGDLISNLLGIKDNIIEQVLTSASADDAAKLLGVDRQD